MTINLDLETPSDTIQVTGGDVTIDFIDNSGCHVDIVFVIQGQKGITLSFEDPKISSVMKTYSIKSGMRYACIVSIYGYSYKTLNRSYDTEIKINGQTILTAKGSMAKNPGFDNGSALFFLDAA